MRQLLLIALLCLSSITQARFSTEENAEVRQRLHAFYARPMDPSVMSRRAPKYDVARHRWAAPRFPMATRANDKTEMRFRDFPALRSTKPGAAVEADDRIQQLAESWIPMTSIAYSLDAIPTKGATTLDLWSDDYWRVQWGITSYRYADYDEESPPDNYFAAIGLYAQPASWQSVFRLPWPELARTILRWSPAEKYDLTVGDTNFTLTGQQKKEGEKHVEGGNVEEWYGICHGWAAASVMDPKPMRSVTVVGASGASLEWYANDIRAIASLSWANGAFDSNYIGGRCEVREPGTYANGRTMQQQCFDTNPATFHLTLGNFVGIERQTFIIDSTFDLEVWNQPIKNYELAYFNPLDPDEQSDSWSAVAVDYDATFKQSDRFQSPLTRGSRGENGVYDDSGISKIVGVIATVEYMSENTPPTFSPVPQEDITRRVTYTYDLELHDYDGRLMPEGGEWHENEHPDFMWLPKKGANVAGEQDLEGIPFTGTTVPDAKVTSLAAAQSAAATPLCAVVHELVRQSSGKEGHPCPSSK